jgi:hypothetical protein
MCQGFVEARAKQPRVDLKDPHIVMHIATALSTVKGQRAHEILFGKAATESWPTWFNTSGWADPARLVGASLAENLRRKFRCGTHHFFCKQVLYTGGLCTGVLHTGGLHTWGCSHWDCTRWDRTQRSAQGDCTRWKTRRVRFRVHALLYAPGTQGMNSPCLGRHAKYCTPFTVPSFFPPGVANSIPSHVPSAKCTSPTNRTTTSIFLYQMLLPTCGTV